MSVGDEGYRVACRVLALREERGWGYAELSRRSGGKLADLALRRIENCERRVDVDDLVLLAQAFDVPVIMLLGFGSAKAPQREKGRLEILESRIDVLENLAGV